MRLGGTVGFELDTAGFGLRPAGRSRVNLAELKRASLPLSLWSRWLQPPWQGTRSLMSGPSKRGARAGRVLGDRPQPACSAVALHWGRRGRWHRCPTQRAW